MRTRSFLSPAVLSLLVAVSLSTPGAAEIPYQTPSQALVDVVDAPRTPEVSLDPTHRWLLLMEVPSLPPIAELAERELRLAGLRISPRRSGPSRSRSFDGLRLLRIRDRETRPVSGLPADPRIENVRWSPDGRHVAFTLTREERIEPWVLEVESARARRLADVALNLVARTPPAWLPSSRSLLVTLVPDGRGPEPPAPAVPEGPVIEESRGREAPARTYQDLLEDPHDEDLFDHYFTSQVAILDLDGGVARVGEPAIVWDLEPSPSGELLLVESLHRPWSYRVPAYRFPRRIEVWDRRGRVAHTLADLPLQEEVPMAFGSVPTGPRNVEWRADAPATLVWVEALDGGDARVEAEERDRVLALAAPFDGAPRELATLGLRYGGMLWGDDDLAIVYESWWQTRRTRAWRLRPGRPTPGGAELDLLVDRSFEDRYADPGSPMLRADAAGRAVLLRLDGDLFMSGDGASPQGDRPFLDVLDPATKQSVRRFRSEGPHYEQPIQLMLRGPDGEAAGEPRFVLTRRESKVEPPNYFIRDLESGELRRLTDFPHPTPQLEGIQKELIGYRREDGVQLTATLYLPAGYDPSQGPLPMLMWAYPREFKSADAAGQVRDSPYRFDRVTHWSPLVWLTLGYAVLDDPALPIVGEGDEEPNDSYVEQLVAGARAAVDEVVRRGVAERGRIAIGGHSYGAFMTANLLSHSDLFAAGIARSGAYNRTLTPFGFQAEQRSLWEAPEIYFAMSPFMHAEKVNEPILLIHGELDNNSGTFPMQSERYYAALQGNGATVRLVMLPFESHGYRARESLLHMLWEQERWLGTWLGKSAGGAP